MFYSRDTCKTLLADQSLLPSSEILKREYELKHGEVYVDARENKRKENIALRKENLSFHSSALFVLTYIEHFMYILLAFFSRKNGRFFVVEEISWKFFRFAHKKRRLFG